MSKPIEPGCKAVIVNSRAGNNGLVVRVIRYIGDVPGFGHTSRWEISEYLKTDQHHYVNHAGEACLRRIDDDNDVISWDDKRSVWKPDELKVGAG